MLSRLNMYYATDTNIQHEDSSHPGGPDLGNGFMPCELVHTRVSRVVRVQPVDCISNEQAHTARNTQQRRGYRRSQSIKLAQPAGPLVVRGSLGILYSPHCCQRKNNYWRLDLFSLSIHTPAVAIATPGKAPCVPGFDFERNG